MNRKKIVSLMVACLLLNSTTVFAKDKKQSLNHDNKKRKYWVHLPKNYSSNKNYPVVIALHGGKGRAKLFNRSTHGRMNELANEENFIVVYPQGIDKSWNDHPERNRYGKARSTNMDDVGFIDKMIDELQKKYSVIQDQIFACGISNGGLMSATLASKLPNKIKAIGMVASNFSAVHLEVMKKNKPKPFSILIIHGTQDPIFPYAPGEIKIFKQTRGAVIGAEESISFMCSLNGNSNIGITSEIPDLDTTDNCQSFRTIYPHPNSKQLKVELVKIVNGGHTWPGGGQYLPKKWIGLVTQDFNAVDELWHFFKSTMD